MNQEQYDRLMRDVVEWNEWREAHCGEVIDLRGANLYRAYLREAYLGGADLREADLYRADLREAYLSGANLREAYLRGADLYGANLRGADLYGADLREANLREADLREADLRGADLYGADLRRAKNVLSMGPGGSRGDMLHAVRGDNGVMIYCGCFKGTIESFLEQVEHTHGDNEHGRYYRAVVEMVNVWA